MRYLFASLSSYGFLLPSLAIARALKKRGHDAAFVADVSMGPVLARAGFERIPRAGQDGRSFQIELAGHPLETVRQVKHLEHAVEVFRPDVLVGHELALGPVVAAERHGLPVAVVGLAAFIWPSAANLASTVEGYAEFVVDRYRGFLESYSLTRDTFHLPPRSLSPEDESPLLGDLFLLRSVPELEGDPAGLPDRVHLVGDCSWSAPAPEPELDAWLAEAAALGQPVLYAQPGRFFEKQGFWEPLAEALDGKPVRVAASVGRMDRRASRIPANFFVRDHVPQERVLPHAAAVLCTSATTAVLGALTHGLPLLAVPGGGGGEQSDLTIRLARAGVAHYLGTDEVTAETLSAPLADLLRPDTPVRRGAQRMRQAFAGAGGVAQAASLLERLGRERATIAREAPVAVASV